MAIPERVFLKNIKATLKYRIRTIAYTKLFQEIICSALKVYMWIVYLTCQKKFINNHKLIEAAKNKKPLILVFWHNRLMMIPFFTLKTKKTYRHYNFMTLASRHGDGRFVGKVMEKFGLISILGSTKTSKNQDRGIPISSLKQIFNGLKKGYSIGLTPDGPRGPNQKINGDIIQMAKISGAGILAISYSCSRFIELKTWDKFKIPLPFSKLCFYADDDEFFVSKKLNALEESDLKKEIEERINSIQKKSQKF
jgi:Kdo2-lipid IVA 3' secondary acyltransferase